LTSLKAELATFEGQYLRAVGVLYAELYEWNARIAELIAAWDGTTEALASTIHQNGTVPVPPTLAIDTRAAFKLRAE
jgi:hypothetical protein